MHRGRVVLVATSADPSWTYMPLCPSFVPLVQEIVAWCVGGQLQQRNLLVGEPLGVSLAAPAAQGAGDASKGPTAAAAPFSFVPAPTTPRSTMRTPRRAASTWHASARRSIARKPSPSTSTRWKATCTQIDPEELQNEVWPGIPFVHQTSWQDFAASGPGSPIRSRSRLHVGLLYVVLGLLFLETFLAWKMGHDDGLSRPQLD